MIDQGAANLLLAAIHANDADTVASLLQQHPEMKARLDDPLPGAGFGQTALLAAVQATSREVIDVLLAAGANINQKSHWWAGPFHVLDDAWRAAWLPAFLLERGAVAEIHHAVRLGWRDDVERMLSADPSRIHQRGGDGQLPLHFAQTIEMADYLIERGADVDARDIDHESTAAQWMVRDRTAVARALTARGGATDVLMASAVGDVGSVTRILDANPGAIRTVVNPSYFPMVNPRAGGSIYIWTLGANKGAHAIAREFGHEEIWSVLMARTPDPMKLAVACDLGEDALATRLLEARPGLVSELTIDDRRRLPDAAQRNDIAAVRRMAGSGWPVDTRGQHHATALHWAGFHGNAEMARVLLQHGAPINLKGDDFDGTPLDWALHGAANREACSSGEYDATIAALRAASG
jgi:ankyrin repeat protein